MARRASLCHLCNISVQGTTVEEYVSGRPVYSKIEIKNVPCRFYNLKGKPENTDSGPHIIEITKIRFYHGVSLESGCKITGLSEGFTREYEVSGLPEVVYGSRTPLFIECFLNSVDGCSS